MICPPERAVRFARMGCPKNLIIVAFRGYVKLSPTEQLQNLSNFSSETTHLEVKAALWYRKKSVKTIKVGIIQFDVSLGVVDRNLVVVRRRAASLSKRGVRLVLLPEMWSTGFANDRLEELSETTPGILEELRGLSKELDIAIIGSLPEKVADGIYNTAYVVDIDGSIAGVYRKVHLFSITGEDQYFRPGNQAVVADTSFGPVGLVICYDLRFPELCRALTFQGAKILAVVAQWPAARIAHWKALLEARAIENQVFVIGANRCGRDKDLIYGGHSRIISPWGDILGRAGKGPASLSATIDFSLVEQIRRRIPCLDERVPAAYE